MNITIIAYRPNHADYCRGCRMGSSDSELEVSYIEYKTDTEDLITEMAEILSEYYYEDMSRDLDYAPYEITILHDGKEIEQPSPYISVCNKAITLGEKFANVKFIHAKNEKIKREQAKADEAEAKAKIKRQEEFKKLQKEFGDE